MSLHLVRRCVLIAVLGAALLIRAAPALAHAILLRSDPPDGAVLSDAPAQIRLWFTEPILLEFTTLELFGANGQSVPVPAMRLDAADPTLLVVDLPPLPPDAYRLTWRTLSTEDVHIATGSVVFGVQHAAALAAAPVVAPPPVEVLLRWLNFAALSGLLGALALALIVLPPLAGSDVAQIPVFMTTRRRLFALALGAGVLALAVGVGLLWVQAQTAGGAVGFADTLVSLQRLLGSTAYGGRWWQRQGLLAELVAAVILLMRRAPQIEGRSSGLGPPPEGANALPRALELVVAVPFALMLVVTQSLSSHAASVKGVSLVSVAVDALHLLAATVWSGGLLGLALVVAPLLRRGPEAKAWAWSVLRRFGGLAAASVAVLAVTGLYNGGQQVASLDALLVTLYGQALIVKLGLVLCVGLIGLLNSAMLHPRVADALRRALRQPAGWGPFAPDQLRRTVRVEAAGIGIVLLLTAVLGATPPARGPEFDPPAVDETPSTFTTTTKDLLITLSIKPNRPGQNFITLGVFNTRRPAPAPIERVLLELQPPGQPAVSLDAEPQGQDKYQIAGDAINIAGQWQISIIVRRTGLPDTVVATPWTVMPAVQSVMRRPVLVSNRPLAPLLTPIAVGLALLIGAFALWLRRQARLAALAASPALATHEQ
jgi:copper transport protein